MKKIHGWTKCSTFCEPSKSTKIFWKIFTGFFWTFFHFFDPQVLYQFLQYVELIDSHLFGAINKIDSTTLPTAAALFPCTVSQAHIPSQLSIGTCLSPNGTFDVDKYQQYAASLLAWARSQSAAIMISIVGGGESHARFVAQEVMLHYFKKLHAKKCVLGCKDTEDGPLCVITPQESGWYRAYACKYLLDDANLVMAKKFRNWFCLPYTSYKDLLTQIKLDDRFEHWCGFKTNAKTNSPVELLLLSLLGYLGRDRTFDDIEEQTAIWISVHRKFFHAFIDFGCTTLYSMHVSTPVDLAEAQSNMAEYTKVEFPGCVGSTDCTHITTETCKYYQKNNQLGGKSSHTTHTFNLMCNHCRWILHTTRGGLGRWNDQFMVQFDTFLTRVRNNQILTDNKFELLAYNKDGSIITVMYRGVFHWWQMDTLHGLVPFLPFHQPTNWQDRMVEMGWVNARGCWMPLWHSEEEMVNPKNRCRCIRCWQGRWYMDDLLWIAQLAVENWRNIISIVIGRVTWDAWTLRGYVNQSQMQ